MRNLLYGYETKYWNKDHYEYTRHPANKQAFAEIIEQWPGCITKEFINELYNWEEPKEFPRFELEGTIALALAENALNLDVQTRMGELVRDAWFDPWLSDNYEMVNGLVWNDLYTYVAERAWLRDRFYTSRNVSWAAALIVGAIAGEIETNKVLQTLTISYPWALELQKCWKGEQYTIPIPQSMNQIIPTSFGRMIALDLIAVLCNRWEWMSTIADEYNQPFYTRVDYVERDGNWGIEYENPVNELIRSVSLKEDLDLYFGNMHPFKFSEEFEPQAILHHPWFKKLREDEDFPIWWNSICHRYKYVEADPLFGLPDDR